MYLEGQWDYTSRQPACSYSSHFSNYAIAEIVDRNRYVRFFRKRRTLKTKDSVIKILANIPRAKIMREIRVLEVLRDADNIILLRGVVRIAVDANGEETRERSLRLRPVKKTTALIFPFVLSVPFDEFYLRHEDIDKRTYLYELLLALDGAHAKGIMHRDLNPKNVLFNAAGRYLRLIGWSCAEFYLDRQLYRPEIGNIEYRAPELLLGRQRYNYAVDMWSFGCIFATLLLQTRVSFFSDRSGAPITSPANRTSLQQLTWIIKMLGKANLTQFLDDHLMKNPISASEWEGFPYESQLARYRTRDVSPEGFDLLQKCLQYDPGRRITAAEAKRHRYFDGFSDEAGRHLRRPSVSVTLPRATRHRTHSPWRNLTRLTPGDDSEAGAASTEYTTDTTDEDRSSGQ